MNFFHRYKNAACVVLLLTILYSCSKSNYLQDGGVANAKSNYTAYDYLSANQYHMFDTVLLIVDHFHLKDSVNLAGTFFAPTDYSVSAIMTALNYQSLDSLYAHITSRFITQFLFTDTISLNNASTTAKIYPNWADTIAAVKKTPATEYVAASTITYYVLQYIKINGYLDGSPGAPANDPVDFVENCQTTGIITKTGSKLNVLSNLASIAIK
ncbi:hypothetical protein [Puia dinghuensis]|uniref:FAS1 domain-containing protein n=1 Tax=Puia dinghuensis TaxID=1792502 RepID=A0A8J2UI28_9BACT|nr:hypothetical protein [Puia dinghuensis]GGB20596.1 hypothetical protein GCM10011511_50420 [Puia dinghuensis]